MKRLLIQVLIFLIPLVILAVGVESFARTIPNSYRYKKEWMDLNKDSLSLLFLGTSHIYSAIDASVFNNAFNLSNSAQLLEYDEWLLSHYINQCPNLKTVVMNLDTSNLFSEEYEGRNNAWNRAVYYNLYMNYPKHGVFTKYHYELSCPKFMCRKVECFLTNVIMGKTYSIECDTLGRGIMYQSAMRKNAEMSAHRIKSKIKKETNLKQRAFQNICYLSSIIEMCEEKDIRLVFIETPIWHIQNELDDENKEIIVYEIMNTLARHYKFEFYDYHDENNISYNMEMFKDPNHLSEVGARYFSQMLKNKLE